MATRWLKSCVFSFSYVRHASVAYGFWSIHHTDVVAKLEGRSNDTGEHCQK